MSWHGDEDGGGRTTMFGASGLTDESRGFLRRRSTQQRTTTTGRLSRPYRALHQDKLPATLVWDVLGHTAKMHPAPPAAAAAGCCCSDLLLLTRIYHYTHTSPDLYPPPPPSLPLPALALSEEHRTHALFHGRNQRSIVPPKCSRKNGHRLLHPALHLFAQRL